MSFSKHSMPHNNAMDETYAEQEDVDKYFADYADAMHTLHPRPAHASRDALLCVNCGSAHYTYDTSVNGGVAGARVCDECGAVQPGNIIHEYLYGRTITTRTSNYKRIHHWHERLSQLMVMESQIPPEHMLAIGEKLLDGSHAVASKDAIRSVLRSLGLQVYIEKWLQIIERCTGVTPPLPGPVVLKHLDELFIELQQPFDCHKHEGRRNFLNYNYVFCRLFQKMNCPKFCMFFPLIRSKVKLRALDDMWTAMAGSLGWSTPPLQHVPAFAVRLDQPALLLERLRPQCVAQTPAAMQVVRSRTATQMWDRRPSVRAPPSRPPPHLVPPEQRPQTLSLRLKRKRSEPA